MTPMYLNNNLYVICFIKMTMEMINTKINCEKTTTFTAIFAGFHRCWTRKISFCITKK